MPRSIRTFAYTPHSQISNLPSVDVDLDDPDVLEPGEGFDWTNQDSNRLRALDQALEICRLLADQELDLYQLAELTGLGQRSCRRYVYALQMAGLDIIVRKPRQYFKPCTYRLDRKSWHGLLYLPHD
jgi:hypothetical protein